jgi:hypothetical protein
LFAWRADDALRIFARAAVSRVELLGVGERGNRVYGEQLVLADLASPDFLRASDRVDLWLHFRWLDTPYSVLVLSMV